MVKVDKTKPRYMITEGGYISKEAQELADKLIANRKTENKKNGGINMANNDYDEELENGMTDAQFKVFLITILEYVQKADSLEEVKDYLKNMIKAMD